MRWRLKSPALRLFTQPLIQTQMKENIKAPRHWPLCGELTGTGEFPAQMASNAENVSIWWRHHEILQLYISYSMCQPLYMLTLSTEIHGWRCAILTDGSVIHVSTAWTLHRFILVFYWYCLIYMHVLSQQWRNKNCELNWINASVYLGLDELTDIIVHDFYNIASVTWQIFIT